MSHAKIIKKIKNKQKINQKDKWFDTNVRNTM